VEITETEFISTTQGKNGLKDSAFKVGKHKGKYEPLQLNLGLRTEMEAQTS
jgi:hypothetical protein